MEETQSFRLIESIDTVAIILNHVDGKNIVYWENIEQVFPGVKRARNGNSVIKFLRGSDQQSVNCCPQSALDVVFSTSVEPVGVNSLRLDPTDHQTNLKDAPADAPMEDRVITALDGTPETALGIFDTSSSPLSDVDASSKATLFQQIVTRASRKARESEIEQRFISLLAPEVQEIVRASWDVYQAFGKAIKDSSGELTRVELGQELSEHLKDLKTMLVAKDTALHKAMNAKQEELKSLMAKNTAEMNAKQEEIKQLQEQALDNDKEMKQLQEQVLDNDKEIKQLQTQNHKEMKQLQIQALGQLAVLQTRVQAVLTQTYELHEYPIPRLFIVLPQYPSGWDILEPFTDKYRLYFLCECGEHTKAAGSNNKIPHEIHLAKHEGYEIARPTDFFQQYSPYVVTILKMLKFSVSVASVAVPATAHLINADAIDHAAKGLQHLKDCIEPGMDQVISKIEKDSMDEGEPVENFADQMENKEALEGADLRKLETFLKDKDGNKVLGNLYRTVTDEGHVKWVCMDHYRENYNKTAAEAFRRTVDAVGGSFDENNGLARVKLQSRVLSEQFYSGLGKARSVYELDISLDLEGTKSDLEALADALKTSNVSILHLNLQQFRPSFSSKLRLTSARYDVLCRIMEHPNMKLIYIVLPRDFIRLSTFPSKPPSHIHKVFIEMSPGSIGAKDLELLSEALKTNSTLATLDLRRNSIGDTGAKALAEALKTNKTLAIQH